MTLKNKWIAIFADYRRSLKQAVLDRAAKGWKTNGISKTNKYKNQSVDFFLKNNRWPSRLSLGVSERKLAVRFENYISVKSPQCDSVLRSLVMATGRTSNNKRSHNVQAFKNDILAFMEENGRAPATGSGPDFSLEEKRLRQKLDYYTTNANDMSFLGQVYDLDQLHRSGIPMKYRAILNDQLNLSKPLVRLVK